jgi:hypothetical protein
MMLALIIVCTIANSASAISLDALDVDVVGEVGKDWISRSRALSMRWNGCKNEVGARRRSLTALCA